MKKSGNWGRCHWDLFDWGYLAIEEGLAASTLTAEDIPWYDVREYVTSVKFEGPVNFAEGASVAHLFDGCRNLQRVDFRNLNTNGVVNMNSMFEDCENLISLNFNILDTSGVTSMVACFMNCTKLRMLDMSGMNTSSLTDNSFMFAGCENLSELNMTGLDLSKVRNSAHIFDNCDKLPTHTKSFAEQEPHIEKHAAPRVPSRENYIDDNETGLVSVNTGVGRRNAWAGSPIFLGNIEQIPPITYGETLELRPPQIDRNNGQELELAVEISPDGVTQWTQFNPSAVLPASGNGCYVRYRATNEFGTSVTPSVRISIRKADYDMTEVRWKGLDNPLYNGELKTVSLVGLPMGVSATYMGNQESEAGDYVATAQLQYDETNYNPPTPVDDMQWRIVRAEYNMRNVKWVYNQPFTYDGNNKEVYLEGLPDGVTPIYRDNVASYVGLYYATVTFAYDERNYNKPEQVMPCAWEIKKSTINMSNIRWTDVTGLTYDGNVHEVKIEGLPSGIIVHYADNRAVDSGSYTAIARFEVVDEINYSVPDKIEYDWKIAKAIYDMNAVSWDYNLPFGYDGSIKSVSLNNVPQGVTVMYFDNKAVDTGVYEARAHFSVIDDVNFIVPEDMRIAWEIQKSDYDMTDVGWNYTAPFIYDGADKRIELINLPAGIIPEYRNSVAINAGTYEATVKLHYDEKNYNKPEFEGCTWHILKADLDVSNVYWDVSENIVYDGKEHRAQLVGLPDSIRPDYNDNIAVDVGNYFTTVRLDAFDSNNFNAPEIRGCEWSIAKAEIDMSKVQWNTDGRYVYNGTVQGVELLNVPDSVDVFYEDNESIGAGYYYARASFMPKDKKNYEVPRDMFLSWEISKCLFELGDIKWDYEEPFVYDGSVREVHVIGLPDGIIPIYNNNRAVDVGIYSAHVEFELSDTDNFIQPKGTGISWEIIKADYNMRPAKWIYDGPFSFDGEQQEVLIGGLPEGVYATYIDNTATEAGEYIASAILHYDERNYNKPAIKDLRWRIKKGEYSLSALRWNYNGNFIYDGRVKTVELDGYNSDVTVRYTMNKAIDAGTYEAKAYISLRDNQNYEPPEVMTLTWEIKKATFDMSNVKWSYDRPFEYSGNACVVTMYNLPEGVWAEYEKNIAVNAGMYEASAEFRVNNADNYIIPSRRTCQWEITKADLDMSRTHWDYRNTLTYNGTEQTVELVGLPLGVSVVYEGNAATDVGLYEASAQLIINDEWNINTPTISNLKWEIKKADYDMSRVEWNYRQPLVYNGEQQFIELDNLPRGVVPQYSGNAATDSGNYEAKVNFKIQNDHNYNMPYVDNCKWRIRKADYDMSEARWSYEEGMFYYDGNSKTIQILGLPKGVTPQYSGNSQTRAGEYTAMAYFTIDNPFNYNVPKMENCRWKINKGIFDMSRSYWSYQEAFVYDGREKRVKINDLPNGITATYLGNSGVNAGSYIASAFLHYDMDNYEQPYFEDLKWTIERAVPDISKARWDYRENFRYDGRIKAVFIVGMPQGMTINYKNNTFIDAGDYVAEAEIIPDDRVNYKEPYMKPCNWSISKADFNMSSVRWVGGDRFVHNGDEHSVRLVGLPEGVSAEYSGNTAISVGKYTAEANLIYDKHNYNYIEVGKHDYTIVKSSYDMSAAVWDYNSSFTYDGHNHEIRIIGLPKGIKPVYNNNSFVNAGEYVASVSFIYDSDNFEEPVMEPCVWRIDKAKLDLSELQWEYETSKKYDGTPKQMHLITLDQKYSFFEKLKGAKDGQLIVGMPEGAMIAYEDDVQINAGKYITRAVIVPDDEDNYEIPKPLECRWEIKKVDPDMSNVKWSYEKPIPYSGKEHSITVSGLPEGVTVDHYEGNIAIEVGTYIARVEFKVPARGNYNQPEGISIRWKIDRKLIDMSAVYWDYKEPFVFDNTSKTVMLLNLPDEVGVSYVNNTRTNPGTFIAKAVLEYDRACYKVPEIEDCKWQIEGEKRI